jgi:hypothetical protein
MLLSYLLIVNKTLLRELRNTLYRPSISTWGFKVHQQCVKAVQFYVNCSNGSHNRSKDYDHSKKRQSYDYCTKNMGFRTVPFFKIIIN